MKTSKKLLATLVVVGVAGSLIAAAVFSAFSATTSNAGNSFNAGTVAISDNDLGAFMYQVTNARPGQVTDKCIKVTYDGSLDSTVKLYTTSTIAAGGQYVHLVVTPGTQASPSFPSCTGFTPDAGGSVYDGTLSAFATAHSSWSNGLSLSGPQGATWLTNDARVYRFSVDLVDDPNAAGATSGTHSFTWEAQS